MKEDEKKRLVFSHPLSLFTMTVRTRLELVISSVTGMRPKPTRPTDHLTTNKSIRNFPSGVNNFFNFLFLLHQP